MYSSIINFRTYTEEQEYKLIREGSEKCDDLDNLCSFFALASEVERMLVIVFRGTRNKFQLLEEGVQSEQPGRDFFGIGKVNDYFFNGLNVLWKDVEYVLANPDYAVSITHKIYNSGDVNFRISTSPSQAIRWAVR